MKNIVLVAFAAYLCAGCAGSVNRSEPRYIEDPLVTEHNTDLLVNLFVSGFWNKSYNDFFSGIYPYGNRTHSRLVTATRNFIYTDGERRRSSPSLKKTDVKDQYGKTPPLLHIEIKGNVVGDPIQVDFGFDSFGIGYRMNPTVRKFASPLRIYVKDAKTLKDRFIAAGVPLFYCYEGPDDKIRHGVYDEPTIITDAEGKKSFTCVLPSSAPFSFRSSVAELKRLWGPRKGLEMAAETMTPYIKFKVNYGVLEHFHVYNLWVSKDELDMPWGEVFHKALLNPEKMQVSKDKLNRMHEYAIWSAEKEFSEANALSDVHRAYERNIRAQSRELFSSAISSSIANSQAQDAQLDQVQRQTMQEIRRYQTARSNISTDSNSSDVTSRSMPLKPRSIKTNAESKAPTTTSNYEAEKQNCLNAGKKWNNGCDYSTTVEIRGWTEGNRATVQPANTTGEKTIAKSQSHGGFDTGANSEESGASQTYKIDKKSTISNPPHAWAYCWKTRSGTFYCDGPLMLLLSSEKTLARALDVTDCPNGKHVTGNWYDCGRTLKWTEYHKERDVRSLRE